MGDEACVSSASVQPIEDEKASAAETFELGVTEEIAQAQGKQRIVKVLVPALRFWIKTQVDAVTDLQVQIQSGDRALLSGKIEQVQLQAQNVIYKGLHIRDVTVTASNIQINLGQILRGKPLRLLAPVPVEGEIQLDQSDLNASVNADLLANALTELVTNFLQLDLAKTGTPPVRLTSAQIQLGTNQVILQGKVVDDQQQQQLVGIQTHLTLSSPQVLLFHDMAWLPDIPACDRKPETWQDIQIDLGQDVTLHQLLLTRGQLQCRASLTIMP